MKVLFRLFLIGFLLALLCLALQSPPAHAQTTSAVSPSPSSAYGTITYLKRGNWGNYYFSPTYISCRTYTRCFTVVNVTGQTVILTDTASNFLASLRSGVFTSQVFAYPGMYYYTDDQQNIRVPLTVQVQDSRGRCGWSRCYPGWRY